MALPPGSQSLRPSLPDLLLTNLRLLDLDRKPDWPNINPRLFYAKDGQGQTQKLRIHYTEWTLYRLFELWDPEGTRDVKSHLSLRSVPSKLITFRLENKLSFPSARTFII
jgi:hypothetical protein